MTQDQLTEVLAHCRSESPLEACGILAGKSSRVEVVYPVINVEKSERRYLMDPTEQFRVMGEIWDQGRELVAIYHSHPASPAYPSATDVDLAYYPDAFYLIVSLAGSKPDLRAFRIRDGKITETGIEIVEE